LLRLEEWMDIKSLHKEGHSIKAIARHTGRSRNTVRRVLHQAGATTLDGASYGYDAAANRTSKTNQRTGVTEGYGYDLIYQLTQVSQGASTTESYSYDAVGNRLSGLTVPSYSYNASNELTSSSQGSYTYDANGNTLSDPSGKSYSWDFENRLTQAVVPGTGTTTFRYDPFGRRIQKSGPLGTTNYLYDGANSVGEVDPSGTVLGRYTQSEGYDEPLAQLRFGVASYYEQDANSSVTSMSNSAGALANTYLYGSFGNLAGSTGSLINSWQFNGRDYDSETGLRYFRARYYDSSVGRFTSEDPIGFDGGVDFYGYVSNNPIYYTDPLGLQQCCQHPTRGKLPGTNVPYRMDMRQQPNPNMHVYWPDGTETVINSRGGWDLTHGGKPVAKPPKCYRSNLRPVVDSFLGRVARATDTALSVFNFVQVFFDEWAAQSELEEQARQHNRTPEEEFCARSRAAGNPDFYMSPLGPLPNTCGKGEVF
jgi:RHS repeat-associated protein